jgi:Ribbon-helix-helix protein, copG family
MNQTLEPFRRTSFVLRPDQLDRLRESAGTEERSVSWLLRRIIDDFYAPARLTPVACPYLEAQVGSLTGTDPAIPEAA